MKPFRERERERGKTGTARERERERKRKSLPYTGNFVGSRFGERNPGLKGYLIVRLIIFIGPAYPFAGNWFTKGDYMF